MSSNHVQELQFSKVSESIKKFDAQYMENATDIIWQKKDNSSEYESKIDYRKSLAWDSAFFTSPGILDPEELFERLNFGDVEHGVNAPGMLPSESLEQERTKSIFESNTRRSLAWNSAFFTSAGVLDPEELYIVNKGCKKSATHVCPEFEEKIWRSTEPNSTINRDGSSLACLETGLFDDLKASNITGSSSEFGRGNGSENTHYLKKLDASSRVKMKSMLALNRQSLNKNGSERNAKAAHLPPKSQHVARGGYSSPLSLLKPPKVSGRVNSPMTPLSKKATLDPKHIQMKSKTTKAASGENMTVSKRTCLGKSSPLSPSLRSHTPTNKPARLGSSLNYSSGRSPLNSLRGKIDYRLAASVSSSPLRNLHGNKVELLNSSLPSNLLSPLEPFCTSPASSTDFDIWSSESSASINQRSNNSIESLDTTCKDIFHGGDGSQALDTESHICDQNCFTHGDQEKRCKADQEKRFMYQHAKIISKGNSSVLANNSRNIKPSGLRKPSPKFGYFDAENFVALTPNREKKLHSGVHNSSKTGRAIASHNGVATRTMHSKLQSAGTLSKIGFQQTGEVFHPLGIGPSRPTSFKENEGNEGFMKIRKGVKREGQEYRRTRKQSLKEHEDAKKQCLLHMLNDDDKENLCSFHNQVDVLSTHIEAINFNQDLVI